MAITILICKEMHLIQWNKHFFRGSGPRVHLIAFIGKWKLAHKIINKSNKRASERETEREKVNISKPERILFEITHRIE